jgi:hypothetical protein
MTRLFPLILASLLGCSASPQTARDGTPLLPLSVQAQPLGVSTLASGLQASLTKAATSGAPVVGIGTIVLTKPLLVPTGIDLSGGVLSYNGTDVPIYFTGPGVRGAHLHHMTIIAPNARAAWDWPADSDGAQDYEFDHLRIECGGVHLNLAPKGDGFFYFGKLDHVSCLGTGPIMDYSGRGTSVSHLTAVNNRFGSNVQQMVSVHESPVIHQLSTIEFVSGNRLESYTGIPLMKISGGSLVEVGGMWWEQQIRRDAQNRPIVTPKVIIEGPYSKLATGYIYGMNATQPLVLTKGGIVDLTGTPLFLGSEGKPLAPGDHDANDPSNPDKNFSALAPRCVIGDGTGVLKYVGGVIPAEAAQPQN